MKCLIVAMTQERIIGKHGTLPWYIPSDLKHFKELTVGSPIIMGKNTFFSLNRVNGLPSRKNVVLSSSEFDHGDNVKIVKTLDDACESVKFSSAPTWFIGGGALYKSVLDADIIDEMHISIIKADYDGDTKFPSYDESKWEMSHFEDKGEFFYKVLTRIRN
jgi:dihydrofolate reductase